MEPNKDWSEGQNQLRLPAQIPPMLPAAPMMQQMHPAVPPAMMHQMHPAVPASMMQQLHPAMMQQMHQMHLHQMQLMQQQMQLQLPFQPLQQSQQMPWQQMLPMPFMRATTPMPLAPSTSQAAIVAPQLDSMPSASSTVKQGTLTGESLHEMKPGASKQDMFADAKPGPSKQEFVSAYEKPSTSKLHHVVKPKKNEKSPEHDDTDHDENKDPDDEDVTDVKAFIRSLKAKKKGRQAQKAAVSSESDDDSDIEPPKKKKLPKRSIETEEEEDDDDDNNEDEEEEEEEVKPKRRSASTQRVTVKRRPPSKAGRKKGSGNKKPTKAQIVEKLKKAEEYIKVLESGKKTQGDTVVISSESEAESEWETWEPPPSPPTLPSPATPPPPPTPPPPATPPLLLQDQDPDPYAIPYDDYGHLMDPVPEDLPFVSVKSLEPIASFTAHACRVCKVHPPTYIIKPCSHVGLCDECSPKYRFLYRSCPGCFKFHEISLDRVFVG